MVKSSEKRWMSRVYNSSLTEKQISVLKLLMQFNTPTYYNKIQAKANKSTLVGLRQILNILTVKELVLKNSSLTKIKYSITEKGKKTLAGLSPLVQNPNDAVPPLRLTEISKQVILKRVPALIKLEEGHRVEGIRGGQSTGQIFYIENCTLKTEKVFNGFGFFDYTQFILSEPEFTAEEVIVQLANNYHAAGYLTSAWIKKIKIAAAHVESNKVK